MFLKNKAQSTMEYAVFITLMTVLFAYIAWNWVGPNVAVGTGIQALMGQTKTTIENGTAALTAVVNNIP